MNLKREGVMAGVSDLVALLPDGRTVLFEVKTAKGKQQDTQKEFQRRSEELGHRYYIVRSLEEFIELEKGLL